MNTKKKRLLEQLAKYFISKGKILTEIEYKKETDVPIRIVFIKRYIGNWAKVTKMIEHNFPEVFEVTKAEPVKKEEPVKEEVAKPTMFKRAAPKPKEGAKDEKAKEE